MNKKEILELIQAGFAPELIELEFNIPLETINKYIEEDEKRKAAELINPNITPLKEKSEERQDLAKQQPNQHSNNTSSSLKSRLITKTPKSKTTENVLDVLRKNYKQIFSTTIPSSYDNVSLNQYKEPTLEEQDKINHEITKLQSLLDSISNSHHSERREKREALIEMINIFKNINSTPKTIEQLNKIRKIFQSNDLENLSISRDDKINLKLARVKKQILEELATVLEQTANQTSDVDELLKLLKQFPLGENSAAYFHIGAIKTKLETRINQLRTAQTISDMRNKVSPEIEAVIKSITTTTFDLQSAREAISQEAQRRVETSPKTKFALTKERHQKQIEIQIRIIIAEQGTKYPVTDPETAITNLMTLFSEKDKETSLSKIVENLTSQGKYDEAKELCSKYIAKRSLDEEESSLSKRARQFRKNVTLVQIGNMIIDQIQKPSNPEEDRIFMELLEENIQKEKLSLHQIILGATPSGEKKISLKDIWYTNTKQK